MFGSSNIGFSTKEYRIGRATKYNVLFLQNARVQFVHTLLAIYFTVTVKICRKYTQYAENYT